MSVSLVVPPNTAAGCGSARRPDSLSLAHLSRQGASSAETRFVGPPRPNSARLGGAGKFTTLRPLRKPCRAARLNWWGNEPPRDTTDPRRTYDWPPSLLPYTCPRSAFPTSAIRKSAPGPSVATLSVKVNSIHPTRQTCRIQMMDRIRAHQKRHWGYRFRNRRQVQANRTGQRLRKGQKKKGW